MILPIVKLYNLVHVTQILTQELSDKKVKLTIEFNSYSKMSPYMYTFATMDDCEKFLSYLKKSYETHVLFDPNLIIKTYKIK